MSQHYFNTQQAGTPVKVLLGWDRPLGHYFLVIEKAAAVTESASTAPQCEGVDDDEGDDDGGYLYSNLNEQDPFGLSLDYFRGVLSELGIQVPEQMFEQVQEDQERRVGNRHVWYQTDGTFEER